MKVRNFAVSLGVLALIGGGMAAAAAPDSFSDVQGYDPNHKAIDYLREEGIVVGYNDGTFGPKNNINRAEFLKIVMEASDHEIDGEDCYEDVTGEWFAPYVCAATDLGFVDGYPDGSFKPAREINFAEASKIVTNILGMDLAEDADYTWFAPYVVALEGQDAIPFNIDGFDRNVTRGDMSEMVWRLMTETTYKISNTYENIAAGEAVVERGGELAPFESCKELKDYFEDNVGSSYYGFGIWSAVEDVAMESDDSDGAERTAAPEAIDLDSGGDEAAEDYSSTNVQVEGVDEADILKNDGKYIYYLKGDTVRIVDAYPPGGMTELDRVTFANADFNPSEMYVDVDRLVVIGTSFEDFHSYSREECEGCISAYESVTTVYIFDISDKTNVDLLRELSFEGSYLSSRKVDDVVYLVANDYNYYLPWEGDVWYEEDLVPKYSDNGEVQPLVNCSDVEYMPGTTGSTSYIVIAAIPIDNPEEPISDHVVIGASSSGNIYASRQNLYVAEPKYNWDWWYEDSGEGEETYIHKFSLDGTNMVYEGVGAVPGTILNQFSMDESGEYFRIATTKGWWNNFGEGGVSVNNLYVLDSNLDVVGAVEGLAPGEEIYSVRFMGDRAYMVTFEMIDPLFVIDLSTPTAPKVLGELHIPGVSNYLHPYDENHLIGFGLDTLSESELEDLGWSWFQGMKVSMFDVTDVENPVELHKVVIGDRGTRSELLYNHKALLFDKAKGLMAFPVVLAEIPQAVKDDIDLDGWVYGDYTFQGAYVYDVSVEDGFTLRGRISHYDEDELGDAFEYYYSYGENKKLLERILYIGEYFYSVSQSMVKANLMTNLAEIGSAVLAD